MSELIFDNTWPKSTRLNKENREVFVRKVVEDLMPDEKEPSHDKFSAEWADRVYDAIYTPHDATMDLLPAWMFIQGDEMNVDMLQHNPNHPLKKGHSGRFEFKLSQKRRMINEETIYSWTPSPGHVPQIPAGHPAIQAYIDYRQAIDDWRVRKDELINTLTEVASKCNTSHQLFRAWPQALKYAACFPYVETAEAKRGGKTDISAEQLDLTAKLAQTVVNSLGQN